MGIPPALRDHVPPPHEPPAFAEQIRTTGGAVYGDADDFDARIAETRDDAEINPWDAGVGFLRSTAVPTLDGRLRVRWHEALPHVVRHAWQYGLPTHAETVPPAELAALTASPHGGEAA
jgi:hypothetical protein